MDRGLLLFPPRHPAKPLFLPLSATCRCTLRHRAWAFGPDARATSDFPGHPLLPPHPRATLFFLVLLALHDSIARWPPQESLSVDPPVRPCRVIVPRGRLTSIRTAVLSPLPGTSLFCLHRASFPAPSAPTPRPSAGLVKAQARPLFRETRTRFQMRPSSLRKVGLSGASGTVALASHATGRRFRFSRGIGPLLKSPALHDRYAPARPRAEAHPQMEARALGTGTSECRREAHGNVEFEWPFCGQALQSALRASVRETRASA